MKGKKITYGVTYLLLSICALFGYSNSLEASAQEEGIDLCLNVTIPTEGTLYSADRPTKPEGYIESAIQQAHQGYSQGNESQEETTSDGNHYSGNGHCHLFHNKQQSLQSVARRESTPHEFSVSRKYYVIALRRIIV